MPARWYTADELLREPAAIAQGLRKRALVEWTQYGLLDHPERRKLKSGKGRGSSPAVWPDAQHRLFLAVLAQRAVLIEQRGLTRAPIPVLCNVPVAWWLFAGSEQVPIRQVRRALCTFMHGPRRGPDDPRLYVSHQKADNEVRRVAELVSPPGLGVRGRKRLRGGIRDAILASSSHGFLDMGELRTRSREAFAVLEDCDLIEHWQHVLTRVVGSRAAIWHIDLNELEDTIFEAARLDHWHTLSAYAESHRDEFPDGETAVNKIANHACADLMFALGRYIEPKSTP